MDTFKRNVELIYALLDLSNSIVGTKIVKNREEFDAIDAQLPKKPMNYCLMVRSATRGHVLKAYDEKFKCRSAPRALGISKGDPKNSRGENWKRLGLYANENISLNVREGVSYVEEENFGVVVGAAEKISIMPDVILIMTEPNNAMRILQGYAYNYGQPKSINMIGNQAVCYESTSVPYQSKEINVSLMCTGTRHQAGWSDSELIVSIPIEKFGKTVEGIFKTVNIMENNRKKEKIYANLSNLGIEIEERFGYNYYNDV